MNPLGRRITQGTPDGLTDSSEVSHMPHLHDCVRGISCENRTGSQEDHTFHAGSHNFPEDPRHVWIAAKQKKWPALPPWVAERRGWLRSPIVPSTSHANALSCGLRTNARTGRRNSTSCLTSSPPMLAVPPVTRIIKEPFVESRLSHPRSKPPALPVSGTVQAFLS
jgi:hypothetical protein